MARVTVPARLGSAVRTAARSRLGRVAAVVLLLAAAFTGWRLSASAAPVYPKGEIGFATGVQRGVYEEYGQLLRGHLAHSMPGVQVRLDNTQGSVENLDRVSSGQDAFAFATTDAVAAYKGAGKDHLRAIARLYDDYLQLVVPANSPVQKVSDLRGMRVGVGQARSGVYLVTQRLLTAAGLNPGRDITPVMLGVGDAADQLRAGKLDAFFWSGGLPTAALSQLSGAVPIRIVPLADLAEPLQNQEGGGADAYRAATIPAETYPLSKPRGATVATVAVPNLLITRDDVDPRLVEGITRSVIDSRDDIGRLVHAAQLVDLRTAAYTAPLPLHEGARRYYTSVKP